MITIPVPDMTCGHCASTIAKAVKDVDSASRCEVDLAAKTVRIDSREDAGAFVAAIAQAGYTPGIASPAA